MSSSLAVKAVDFLIWRAQKQHDPKRIAKMLTEEVFT
jgi:hypothetical protein